MKLSLPTRKKGGPVSSPAGPGFARQLWSDLRERKLHLVLFALLACLVAVPLVFSAKPRTAPAPVDATSAAAEKAALETDPVTVTESSGLREYRRRLQGLHSKNPFEQQFRGAPAGSHVSVSGSGSDSTVSVSGAGGGAASGAGKVSVSGSIGGGKSGKGSSGGGGLVTTSGASSSRSGSGGTTTSGGGTKSTGTTSSESTVDVKVVKNGGKTRTHKDVKPLSLLPSDDDPVISYLGATSDHKQAKFLVSSSDASTHGDGSCAPSKSKCTFLTLKPGERHVIEVGSDVYSVTLVGISSK